MLSTERSRTITPLTSGTKYFFQVRAIHKGYVMYGGLNGDANYKREENHKFLAITTQLPTGSFNFETSLVRAVHPDGAAALTNIDVTWSPATGDFDHYRVFYKELGKEKVLGDPVENPLLVDPFNPVPPDYFTDLQIDRLNGLVKYDRVDADATYFRLTNLPSYRHFQIKVVACGNPTCELSHRQSSILALAGADYTSSTPTYPAIAPFDGINHIDHPRSETTTRRIHAVFNPPVVASGYLDDLGLYCYASPTDPAPKKLVYAKSLVGPGGAALGGASVEIEDGDYVNFPDSGAVAIGTPGDADFEVFSYTSKATVPSRLVSTNDTLDFVHPAGTDVNFSIKSADNCNGVFRSTQTPSTQSAFETFTQIDIDGIVPSVGKQYCFSLVPKIDGDNTHYQTNNFVDIEDVSHALVKCITPEIKTPTLAQFPGKLTNCSVSGRTINVAWNAPTGGMYNNFQVFWMRNLGTPFQFAQAKNVVPPGGPDPDYWTKEGINKAFTGYTVDPTTLGKPPLIPGERYFTGVLSYLQVGLDRYYSETNLATNDCLIALPTVQFQEWTEIFAVGPKVDGLIPPDLNTGKRTMILETLDESTVPVEALLIGSGSGAGVNIDEDPTSGFYLSRGATEFNGVYGTKDGDTANPKYQYSNMGMVRLAWKDMKFYSAPDLYMDDMISSYESPATLQNGNYPFPFPTTKDKRMFGYKVYRSENNKVTWTELTHKDFPYQRAANAGLVRASDRVTRVRNNATPDTDRVVTFTDYSVQFVDNNGEVERGRVYWYKIVPIFNNIPLPLSDSSNIIKVTLPPPNMALVHRMMANRTICREIGKPIDKSPGKYYSCPYNGLGARGLNLPWPVFTGLPGDPYPVYDLGGDLLVDRFELGCNFTRGDPRATAVAQSDFDGDQSGKGVYNFQGKTLAWKGGNSGQNFYGCAQTRWSSDEPMWGHAGSGSSNTDTSYGRVHQGDCFGNGITYMAGGKCADYTKTVVEPYAFPGAGGWAINNDATENCQDGSDYKVGTFYGDTPGSGIPNYPNYWGGDPWAVPNTSNDGYPWQNTLAQSEPAAVYYLRGRTGAYPQYYYPSSAGPGSYITDPGGYSTLATQCFINLPFVNVNHSNPAMIGNWTARWFGLNKLFRNNLIAPVNGAVTLYNKTVDQVLAMTGFYSPGTQPNVWPQQMRFNKSTTPIGKIISSNNAKLPPLGSLAQIDVYDLCQLYQVELGAYDSAAGSGSGVFYQSAAPAKKRIMTKKEFNVVAAWPDIDSSATSGDPAVNTYDLDMINGIEQGTAGVSPMYMHPRIKLSGGLVDVSDQAGCNTQGKLSGGRDAWWDQKLTPLFPSVWGEADPYLWGGSSSNDANSTSVNSSRCISKFGVQDLVGNMMEVVAEQIFCDFSGEVMYLGPAKDDQPSSIRMSVNQGLGAPVMTGGDVSLGGPDEVYTGGDRSLSWWGSAFPYVTGPGAPLYAWVLSQQNTGQCSTAQIGGAREKNTGMSYRSGTSMNSIFDSATWSGYNDVVLEWHGGIGPPFGSGSGYGARRTFGQELVLDDRGGDGYFLDWGQANFGPPIAYNEVMGIKAPGVNSKAMFFNPATGMPGACLEGPGYPAPCVDSPDNKEWTTAAMAAAHAADPILVAANPTNFPTNNGEAHNDGLRDLSFSGWYSSPNTYWTPFRYINSVVAGNADPDDDQWIVKYASGHLPDTVTTQWAWWLISRSDPMYMNVGGDVSTPDAGRYYMYMRGDSPYNQEDYYTRGGRCVIKVNTAD